MKKIIGFILCAGILVGMIIVGYIYQNKPKISVILPTYNREAMLPNAIDSILRQTYTNFELIVINDGSVDDTQKILEEYAAKDKRIKIIKHEQNKGLVCSLNEGLEQARGEYIARMDDDDVSYRKRFEKQLTYMEEHPDVATVGTWGGSFYNDGIYSVWGETDSEYIKIKTLLGLTPLAHSSLLLRSSFLKKHHIHYKDEYRSAEDLPLLADILIAGGKLANIPEKLMKIRLHRRNSSQYYDQQKNSRERYIKDYFKSIFDIDIEGDIPEMCVLLKMIKDQNQKGFIAPGKIEGFNSQDWVKCQI